jgi:hypothetical protein
MLSSREEHSLSLRKEKLAKELLLKRCRPKLDDNSHDLEIDIASLEIDKEFLAYTNFSELVRIMYLFTRLMKYTKIFII